jgi:hypothetical protein
MLTSHNWGTGLGHVFAFTFVPVLVFGPPPMLGLVGKPGKVPGAAHVLEQKI